jgi:hypothetical protein
MQIAVDNYADKLPIASLLLPAFLQGYSCHDEPYFPTIWATLNG